MYMCAKPERKVVLVVDDVSLNLTAIKSLLSRDFDVRIAKSGELALFILGSTKIDLILLDIEMPSMSGFDFMDVLRDIPEVRDIPVIFVTSHANSASIHKALRAGAKDYVVKPIDNKVLREKVFKVFNMDVPY